MKRSSLLFAALLVLFVVGFGCAKRKSDVEYEKSGNYGSYTKMTKLCIDGGEYGYIEKDGKTFIVPLFRNGFYGAYGKPCKG